MVHALYTEDLSVLMRIDAIQVRAKDLSVCFHDDNGKMFSTEIILLNIGYIIEK